MIQMQTTLDVADSIKAKMGELEKRFPLGLKYTIAYDTTPFITESVGEVFNSIWDCKELIQEQLIDYIRTTVVHAGGITHMRRSTTTSTAANRHAGLPCDCGSLRRWPLGAGTGACRQR